MSERINITKLSKIRQKSKFGGRKPLWGSFGANEYDNSIYFPGFAAGPDCLCRKVLYSGAPEAYAYLTDRGDVASVKIICIMIIGYLRVSMGKQHLANQQDEIRRFAESRNLVVDHLLRK